MKSPTGLVAVVICGVTCALTGCAHMIEANAIEQFTLALSEQSIEQLRESTSPEFENKALRRAEALRDLKILNLPEETPSIVDIRDVSDTQKDVTVQIGDRGARLLYKLVREQDSDNWVVDDIYMKQRRKGLKVTKSVTEQMDLLLTVREFLEAWEQGSRDEVLDITTPQFRAVLADLPPTSLQQVTQMVIGDQDLSRSSSRPEAQLDQDVAIVKLPRPDGSLLLNLRLLEKGWKIADIAIDVPDSESAVRSISRTCQVLRAANDFLDAYSRSDKTGLKDLTTRKLYRHSLLPGDLTLVSLPTGAESGSRLDVRLYGERASLITPFRNRMVKIDLEAASDGTDSPATRPFLVSEVTVYEAGSDQRKRLSSVFTARERIRLFVEALASRDLQMLSAISTPELNEAVWKRVDRATLQALPVFGIIDVVPTQMDVSFQGAYTAIQTIQNGVPVRYDMQDWNGELGLHDIHFEQNGFPESFRSRMELYLPILEFGIAVHRGEMNRLKRVSSDDFNRLVWAQVAAVPDIGFPVSQHLQAAPTAITKLGSERAEVRLGDESWGARVLLGKQKGQWVVDEVLLIAGRESQRRAEMKQTIRVQIANGLVSQKHAREYRANFLGVESRTRSGYVSMPAREGASLGPQNVDTSALPRIRPAGSSDPLVTPSALPVIQPRRTGTPVSGQAKALQGGALTDPINIPLQ